jgi:hypothetical protein
VSPLKGKKTLFFIKGSPFGKTLLLSTSKAILEKSSNLFGRERIWDFDYEW